MTIIVAQSVGNNHFAHGSGCTTAAAYLLAIVSENKINPAFLF